MEDAPGFIASDDRYYSCSYTRATRCVGTVEEEEDAPGICGLLEELGVVVTIPTFDIIVLQVIRAACPTGYGDVSLA